MPKNKNYLSVPEAARELRVSLKWIYDLVRSGKVQADRVAGRWRIPVTEIQARLKQRGQSWPKLSLSCSH
jgi:excisionase family DNA binding protein